MKNSKIEWTDHTFNPWIGCTKVSPGCANCYAEALNKRMQWCVWGPTGKRQRTSAANWKQPLKWNKDASLAEAAHWPPSVPYVRPRVFCASLADWLDDEVPIEWLADLLDLIHNTPNLAWLLLTKRPENWRKRITAVVEMRNARAVNLGVALGHWGELWLNGYMPPANVWIGTTVEDQERADERIPALLSIPAKVRFLSCEPLLGPVDLPATAGDPPNCGFALTDGFGRVDGEGLGIHWVICGGESGPKARPMHPDWARSLRDQCKAADVPFFFKQWGEYVDNANMPPDLEVAEECRFEVVDDHYPLWRVGKHAAGRLLDGVEHHAFPAP